MDRAFPARTFVPTVAAPVHGRAAVRAGRNVSVRVVLVRLPETQVPGRPGGRFRIPAGSPGARRENYHATH